MTLSFQCNFVMWNDSVTWNDTLRDIRKMDPQRTSDRNPSQPFDDLEVVGCADLTPSSFLLVVADTLLVAFSLASFSRLAMKASNGSSSESEPPAFSGAAPGDLGKETFLISTQQNHDILLCKVRKNFHQSNTIRPLVLTYPGAGWYGMSSSASEAFNCCCFSSSSSSSKYSSSVLALLTEISPDSLYWTAWKQQNSIFKDGLDAFRL